MLKPGFHTAKIQSARLVDGKIQFAVTVNEMVEFGFVTKVQSMPELTPKQAHFPQYIKSRDSYPKKTCLWTGSGFVIPPLAPVSVLSGYSAQYKKLGGKSTKTKMIRSLTPRGFARAVYLHNYKGVQK